MREFGSIFKDKFGKDPKKLTIKEIEKIAIEKKNRKLKKINTSLVSSRGNVFEIDFYDIDKKFDEALRKF